MLTDRMSSDEPVVECTVLALLLLNTCITALEAEGLKRRDLT